MQRTLKAIQLWTFAISINPTTKSEVEKILGRAKARRSSDISSFSTTYTNYLSASLTFWERRDKLLNFTDRSRASEIRNIVLIVAVLMVTATYQAVLSPPGGYWQDDSVPAVPNAYDGSPAAAPAPSLNATDDKKAHYAGQMIMSGFTMGIFMAANTLAFYISMGIIVLFVTELPFDFIMINICCFLSLTYLYALVHNLPASSSKRVRIPLMVIVLVSYCSYPFIRRSISRHRKRRSQMDPPRIHAKEFEGLFGRR